MHGKPRLPNAANFFCHFEFKCELPINGSTGSTGSNLQISGLPIAPVGLSGSRVQLDSCQGRASSSPRTTTTRVGIHHSDPTRRGRQRRPQTRAGASSPAASYRGKARRAILVSMTVTRRILLRGGAVPPSALAWKLEQHGVDVQPWEPPEEGRGLGTDIIIAIIVDGGIEAIKAGVAEFPQNFPTSSCRDRRRRRRSGRRGSRGRQRPRNHLSLTTDSLRTSFGRGSPQATRCHRSVSYGRSSTWTGKRLFVQKSCSRKRVYCERSLTGGVYVSSSC